MNSKQLFGDMINATNSKTSRLSISMPTTNPNKRSNSAVALPKILNGEQNELSIIVIAIWLHLEKFNCWKIPSTSLSIHSIMRKLHSSRRLSLDFCTSSSLRAIRGRLLEEVLAGFRAGKTGRMVSDAQICAFAISGGESEGKFSKGEDGRAGSRPTMSNVDWMAIRGRLPLKIDGRSWSQNDGSLSLNSEESGGFSLGVRNGIYRYHSHSQQSIFPSNTRHSIPPRCCQKHSLCRRSFLLRPRAPFSCFSIFFPFLNFFAVFISHTTIGVRACKWEYNPGVVVQAETCHAPDEIKCEELIADIKTLQCSCSLLWFES